MTTEAIARIIYEAMRRLNHEAGLFHYNFSWEDSFQETKTLFIEGVKLHLQHPEWTGRDTHDYWMQDRLANGWTYGPERDTEKKTHPCLVDFNELSTFEQVKDTLFASMVQALAPLLLSDV